MKCSRCGTENTGNICVKCGKHLVNDDNIQNSIFFNNVESNDQNNNIKENSLLHDESLNSIMNMTKKIIEENKEINESLNKEQSLIQNVNLELLENKVTNEPQLFEQQSDKIEIIELENNNDKLKNIKNDVNNVPILEKPIESEQKLFDDNLVNNKNTKQLENNNLDGQKLNNNVGESSAISIKPLIENEESVENNEQKNLEIGEIEQLVPFSENNADNQIKDKPNNNSKEKSYLDIFVGKNAERIIHKKYNILPALLGNIWLLYRKCYLIGILFGLFDFVFILYVVFFTNTPVYVYLLLKVVLYFLISKEIYINHAKKKIKKLKEKYNNLSDEEFTKILTKSGGTTLISPIIYVLIVILITIFGFYYIYNLSTYKFYELKLRGNGWVLNNDEGLIYGDNEKTCIADIYYGTRIDDNLTSKLFEKGIITEEQYINKATDYNFDGLDKENINGNDWYKLTIVDENSIYEDVIITEKNDAVYFINFKGNGQNDYNLCQEKFIDLKNSFDF